MGYTLRTFIYLKIMSFLRFSKTLLLFPTLAISCAIAAVPGSDHLLAQRERFPLVLEAAQHAPDIFWRKLAVGLEDYPLYPYLQLAALQQRMHQLTRKDVDTFLTAWPDSLPAQTLRTAFLHELAQRDDWKEFLDLYTASGQSTELQCAALQARLALGKTPDFDHDIAPLWLSASALPSACDAAVTWAQQQGKLTPMLIWQRIDLAARAGHADLVTTLASLLEGTQRDAAERMAAAIGDPAAALQQADAWPDAEHARAAATVAFVRLARRDSDTAEERWTALSPHFHFAAEQRHLILRTIAVYRAADYAPDALQRLAELPAAANDDASREWRVRVAVAAQEWKAALAGLDALSDTQKADARWRYLRARVLVKLGQTEAATSVFESVAREANFHGFLAADWLKQPYTICPTQLHGDARTDAALERDPNLARAFELFAINQLADARREWDFALPRLNPDQRRAAAALASKFGWYDRAIYAFNHGDDLQLYALRFPLAQRKHIQAYAQAAEIDPSWAYAIIRAESAWTSDAHSGANAWGLMQLLPGTARQLAKVENVSFTGAAALLDPDLNIRLGTRYLGNMALRYDGSPMLATAAYNAGSNPVGRWINARDRLEPDFFIETIPYKETRDYVARVLAFSVIYDWRLHGKVLPLASRLPRIGQAYSPAASDAPRKDVVCPATPTDVSEDPAANATTPPDHP